MQLQVARSTRVSSISDFMPGRRITPSLATSSSKYLGEPSEVTARFLNGE